MWVNFKLMTAVSVGQFKIVVDKAAFTFFQRLCPFAFKHSYSCLSLSASAMALTVTSGLACGTAATRGLIHTVATAHPVPDSSAPSHLS